MATAVLTPVVAAASSAIDAPALEPAATQTQPQPQSQPAATQTQSQPPSADDAPGPAASTSAPDAVPGDQSPPVPSGVTRLDAPSALSPTPRLGESTVGTLDEPAPAAALGSDPQPAPEPGVTAGPQPLPPAPANAPGQRSRFPFRAKRFASLAPTVEIPVLGDARVAGTLYAVAMDMAVGVRPHPLVGVWSGMLWGPHLAETRLAYDADDQPYDLTRVGMFVSWDAINVRMYAPVHPRVDLFADVGTGMMVTRSPFLDEDRVGVTVLGALGLVGYVGRSAWLGVVAQVRGAFAHGEHGLRVSVAPTIGLDF